MSEFQLSQPAQYWAIVVLAWIGFGSVAGLLARGILPVREPASPLPNLALGVAGSAMGLAVLSWLSQQPVNPISLLGILSAAGGAAVLLVVYQLVLASWPKPKEDEEADATADEDE